MSDLTTQQVNTTTPVAEGTPILTMARNQLTSIDSSSSVWEDYKHLDVNNNGTLADDNISDATLLEYGQKYGLIPDGTMDSRLNQGLANDCWLIAETKALADTSWGAAAIEQALDFKGHTGTDADPYVVKIYNTEGVQIEIEVTNADLSERYSKGEIDMRILEAGIDKYLADEVAAGRRNIDAEEPLEGGVGAGKYSMYYMLAGKEGKGLTSVQIIDEYKDIFQPLTEDNSTAALRNKLGNDDVAMTCAFKKPSFFKSLFMKDKGQQVPNHAYTITSVSKDADGNISTVSYVNPWDTNKEYTMPYKEFMKNVEQLTWAE